MFIQSYTFISFSKFWLNFVTILIKCWCHESGKTLDYIFNRLEDPLIKEILISQWFDWHFISLWIYDTFFDWQFISLWIDDTFFDWHFIDLLSLTCQFSFKFLLLYVFLFLFQIRLIFSIFQWLIFLNRNWWWNSNPFLSKFSPIYLPTRMQSHFLWILCRLH